MKKLSLLFITVVLLAVYSCGPSVEGESKNWNRNVDKLKKMQTDYPAYADMIKEKIEEAEKVYSEAQNISEEEAKAEKMREANNLLNQGCIGNLKDMNSKIEEVKKQKRELKNMMKGKAENDIRYAENVIEDSKDAIKKAEKVLNKKAEKLDANPCLKIEDAYKELVATNDDIKNAISNFKDIDKKIEEEKVDSVTEKKEETAKMVECEYCGKMIEAGKAECKYCGASVKK